jgi:hypothetical protein
MNRNESLGRPPSTSAPKLGRFPRLGQVLALSAAVVLGLGALAAPVAKGADYWGYGSPRTYGYYGAYRYDDPYHRYTGPRNHHEGSHSAPHIGPHLHWRHGYHYGPHWQRHDDDHSKGGHFGFRPWRPH